MQFSTEPVILLFPLVLAIIIFYARAKGYWGLTMCGLSFVLLILSAMGVSVGGAARFAVIGFILISVAIAKGMFNINKIFATVVAFCPAALLGLFVLALTIINEFQRASMWQRIAVFFNPSVAPYTRGFWPMMIRGLLSEAVFFGQGGTEWFYVFFYPSLSRPLNVSNHSVLAALIVLTGWASFVVIVSALLFFLVKGASRCFRQKSSLGLLVSSAIMLTLALQTLDYVVFNLGFQISSPISLPLVVSGNTALVVNMVLIGFMLSVFRTGDAVMDKYHDTKTGKLVSWEDGKLVISLMS